MLIEVGAVEVTSSLEDFPTLWRQAVPAFNGNWFPTLVEDRVAVVILKCATEVQPLNIFLTDGDLPL